MALYCSNQLIIHVWNSLFCDGNDNQGLPLVITLSRDYESSTLAFETNKRDKAKEYRNSCCASAYRYFTEKDGCYRDSEFT